ncbi:MAG: hypothetical protein J5631_08245 [Spirochaetaceae bacterium]|nr:hypothetical protein [Spirochaetaceae bacterium]
MDEKLEYFKKKILAHLDDLEQKENAEKKELKKSLIAFEMTSIEKAGYPVGTIREWKGKKYIKVAPGKWKPKYDSHSRGAKMAIAALKKKIDACTDSEELMQIILENRDRFSDENGRPLPFVKELSDYISGRNDTIESEKTEKKAADEKIKNHFAEQAKKYGVDVNVENGIVSISKDGKKFSHVFKYEEGKKDGHGDDWNDGAFGNLIIYARQEGLKTPKKEEPKNTEFTLDDIRHIGDGKETKKVNDMETAKNVIKQIAEKYGATEKGRKELSDFIALNIGGSNPLYDKIYEEFNISYEDLDMDSDACHDLMLNQSLGKDTKKQREQISDSKDEFEDNYRQMLEDEDNRYKEDEKIKRGKEIDALVDSKAKEYAEDSYTKYAAQSAIKRLGEKKLAQYANLNIKDDEEFLSELKKKIAETEEKNGEPVSEYTIGTAVWNHFQKKYAKEFAREKLKTMYQNEQDKGEDIPVDEKDMNEAESIIGADVKRILDGRDTFGNAKQTLTDKIKRRIRNNPGVARAMLVYIQKEQEKSGKKVFTDKHSIWEELPKLNENARKAKENGERETKTGVSGNLYEGEDGTTVVENKDWGRYQISFPGKPDGETISMLKRNGFRWSPSTKTWVCFNTANGEYSLKRVAEKLGLKKNDEVKKSLFDSLEDSFPYDDEMDSEDEIKKAVADVLGELAQGDK